MGKEVVTKFFDFTRLALHDHAAAHNEQNITRTVMNRARKFSGTYDVPFPPALDALIDRHSEWSVPQTLLLTERIFTNLVELFCSKRTKLVYFVRLQ